MIKSNFKLKVIKEESEDKEQRELEALIERAGAGSHMVFRSEKKGEELFIDEL